MQISLIIIQVFMLSVLCGAENTKPDQLPEQQCQEHLVLSKDKSILKWDHKCIPNIKHMFVIDVLIIKKWDKNKDGTIIARDGDITFPKNAKGEKDPRKLKGSITCDLKLGTVSVNIVVIDANGKEKKYYRNGKAKFKY